jgi:hypothetical protein
MVSVLASCTYVDRGFMGGVMVSVLASCTYVDRGFIGGVMVSVLASCTYVDRGFMPQSGQTKDSKLGIYYFSTKHAALRRKSKDWLARDQDNLSEWGDMSIHKLYVASVS